MDFLAERARRPLLVAACLGILLAGSCSRQPRENSVREPQWVSTAQLPTSRVGSPLSNDRWPYVMEVRWFESSEVPAAVSAHYQRIRGRGPFEGDGEGGEILIGERFLYPPWELLLELGPFDCPDMGWVIENALIEDYLPYAPMEQGRFTGVVRIFADRNAPFIQVQRIMGVMTRDRVGLSAVELVVQDETTGEQRGILVHLDPGD